MGGEAFGVAQGGATDSEEPHAHDGDKQEHDRRLLAGPHNQPAREGSEGEREEARAGAESDRSDESSEGGAHKLEQAGESRAG